jgi:ribose 5-phosphate isomerase B
VLPGHNQLITNIKASKIMNISIGADHAGFQLKEKVKKYLVEKGHQVKDFGCYSEERADYPDFAHAVSLSVSGRETELGILVCGSGNGISMAANKHKGIRSAVCWMMEIAQLARQHNDANVMALPARFITEEEACRCADAFLAAKFEGGRHAGRVDKLNAFC